MIEIDREHPDYKLQKFMWRSYRDLYAGGEFFKHRASEYLLRRQKEPLDVYGERLNRVFYENYIGSIIDWYAATLFRIEPNLAFENGTALSRQFFAQFSGDCDLHGTRLGQFFRSCVIDMLVGGKSHILVDFPRAPKPAENRAEEDAAGLSRAFLVRYGAEELINWSVDETGQYEWVVLRRSQLKQESAETADLVEETYWYYFDKRSYQTYKCVAKRNETAPIVLVSQGLHGLARQNRVPLFSLQVSDGLWLMNKAAMLQLEHFNKSNALGWAITMGLFAMPVIYSDLQWNQIVGESYYIQLGPQDRFGWTEPEGKVYGIAADNLERLKEEIYRVCYFAEASGEMTGGRAQSVASKQMDFTITQEVLRSYGDSVKNTMQRVLDAVSAARGDGMFISVSGLDEFDIGDFGTELAEASQLLALGIESPTLRRQIFQRLAFKYLSDARQETKDQIAREIDQQFAQ